MHHGLSHSRHWDNSHAEGFLIMLTASKQTGILELPTGTITSHIEENCQVIEKDLSQIGVSSRHFANRDKQLALGSRNEG